MKSAVRRTLIHSKKSIVISASDFVIALSPYCGLGACAMKVIK
jgi:hypothetical protein